MVPCWAILMRSFARVSAGKTIGQRRARRSAEHLAEIDHRVASDGEGKFGLLRAGTFDSGNGKCADIQDGGERADPGLIVVLGAEVRENRIRKMGLKQVRRTNAPILSANRAELLCRWDKRGGEEVRPRSGAFRHAHRAEKYWFRGGQKRHR